ncbi:MAG TPA: hypothetical protein VF630_14520 [Hymenobacter sp.]|jgi:hypothetical protein
MKHSTLRQWLLALALPLLALSCEKPRPEPAAVPLPAELKAYVLFQPGTHWVYQDSATQQLDSVWVVSTEVSIRRRGIKGQSRPDLKYEDFHLRTRSSRGGPDLVYGVSRLCTLPSRDDGNDQYPCWVVTRGEFRPGSTADEGGAYVLPYTLPRNYARPDYVLGLKPYWYTAPLTFGGQSYPDVLEVLNPTDASEGGWPARYYWAPGLGIVRQRVRVNFVPHTRTLVRSRIVQ